MRTDARSEALSDRCRGEGSSLLAIECGDVKTEAVLLGGSCAGVGSGREWYDCVSECGDVRTEAVLLGSSCPGASSGGEWFDCVSEWGDVRTEAVLGRGSEPGSGAGSGDE